MKKGLNGRNPIGVTVISPAYRAVGREAVRRFRKYTGLEVEVIRCRDEEGYATKLELDRHPRLRGRQIVFFDADWWLLRPWPELSGMAMRGCMIGVHDPMVWHGADTAFPARDCETLKLDKHRYVNTGFLVADFSCAGHRRVWQSARRTWRKGVPAMMDKTDQGHLNLAVHESGIQMIIPPFAYNCYLRAVEWGVFPYVPRGIMGLHGAGIPTSEKLGVMQAQAAALGVEHHTMEPEAMAFHHAHNYELR